MATVKAFIRTSKKNTAKVKVRFRLTDGRSVQLFHRSEIEVEPELWDKKKECYKAKCLIDATKRTDFNKAISDRKNLIQEVYNKRNPIVDLDSEKFELMIDQAVNPLKYKSSIECESFFDSFDVFLEKRKMSDERKEGYLVVKRALQRYELFVSSLEKKICRLELGKLTVDVLEDIESFLRNEHTLCEEYPGIYDIIKEKRKPKPRGQNRLNDIMKRIRSFVLWAIDSGRTTNNPFKKYSIGECVYGTPVYITIDERNQIYKADLSHRPKLAIQRDVFVFQCLIGCRVGDLRKMTKDNVIDGAIEYIPHKTKEGNPITVRVPLNDIAKKIIDRYKAEDDKLLPFISDQKYNEAIKDIFKLAGITRVVTIINPTTRKEEKRPINEIASSHLARRTFIGNLYKKVKDPNLVGSLSGHKEGSRAFVRYRDIDEEMKTELVKMLE